MKIENVATVTQGVFLSRVSVHESDSKGVWVDIYNPPNVRESGKNVFKAFIKPLKKPKEVTTRIGDIIVGISNKKAHAITKEKDIGLVVVSNFVVIRPNHNIDAAFFSWYFNHHNSMLKQHSLAQQGVGMTVLSVQAIREMEIDMPDMSIQKNIGKIYVLLEEKRELVQLQLELEEQVAMEHLKNVYERGIHK